MRFGAFLAPFQRFDESPTLQIHRDLDLVTHLDDLGFDELWIGEHHSGAYEIVASPEIFIAGAAERSQRIRLGTGVVSLPYHNPLMLADRIMQLDHQTRGRVMFGVGPGQLASDAFMLGIDTDRQREMMRESLDVLVPLLSGESVSRKTDWFELSEARLQLAPYSQPRVEMAVAGSISPSGPSAAGAHGIGLLSLAATHSKGFDELPKHWSVYSERAAANHHEADRSRWRLVAPMHLAETREQAEADLHYGILHLVKYMEMIGGSPLPYGRSAEAAIEQWRTEGFNILGIAVVGTPDDAVEKIEQLQKQSGGFGTFLLLDHNCADPARKLESYELFSRYVMPAVNASNRGRAASIDWVNTNSQRLTTAIAGGIGKEIAEHEQRRAEGETAVAWVPDTAGDDA